jgi:hypothetical protein
MTDRLSRGQQCGKDGSRVRLACTVEVALESPFVRWITKERAAPLPVGFRCGHPRNEAFKVAPPERAERDLGGPFLHAYSTMWFSDGLTGSRFPALQELLSM